MMLYRSRWIGVTSKLLPMIGADGWCLTKPRKARMGFSTPLVEMYFAKKALIVLRKQKDEHVPFSPVYIRRLR
jgi:hypothetical protein